VSVTRIISCLEFRFLKEEERRLIEVVNRVIVPIRSHYQVDIGDDYTLRSELADSEGGLFRFANEADASQSSIIGNPI
jgi:hypothetical protein